MCIDLTWRNAENLCPITEKAECMAGRVLFCGAV